MCLLRKYILKNRHIVHKSTLLETLHQEQNRAENLQKPAG